MPDVPPATDRRRTRAEAEVLGAELAQEVREWEYALDRLADDGSPVHLYEERQER